MNSYVDNDCLDSRMAVICSSRRRRRNSRNAALRRSRASWQSRSFSDTDFSLVTALRPDIDDDDEWSSVSMLRRSSSSCCWCRLSRCSLRAFYKWQSAIQKIIFYITITLLLLLLTTINTKLNYPLSFNAFARAEPFRISGWIFYPKN